MKKKDDSEDDGYSTDEFEDSMDGGVDSKITAAKEYESDEFEDSEEETEEVRGENIVSKKSDNKGWNHIDYDELEIKEQIAGGGFAVVYKGYWKRQKVALKTLFDPDYERVKREYMDELLVMSKLKHPNVVQLLGACMKPPKLFFVMELCGMSLFQLLHLTDRDISIKTRLRYLIDTAAALKYLHSLSPKIVHRDIKSLNCLLHKESGGIKVCDFGLVSTRKKEAGTPAYMAPELLEDYMTYSTPVDVYAFAMLCWETLCRKIPYEGLDAPSIRKHTLKSKRPEIPTLDFPEDCADLVRECWHPRAARRPDMKEVHRRMIKCKDNIRDVSSLKTLRQGDMDSLDSLFSNTN